MPSAPLRFCQWLAACLIVGSLTTIPGISRGYDGADAALPDPRPLFDRWNAQCDEIVTAQLELRHLQMLGSDKDKAANPTRDEVLHFIKSRLVPLLGRANADAMMERETAAFMNANQRRDRGVYALWEDLRIVESGPLVRNDCRYASELGPDTRTICWDGTAEIRYVGGTKQASVFGHNTPVKKFRVRDVRREPKHYRDAVAAERARLGDAFSADALVAFIEKDGGTIQRSRDGRGRLTAKGGRVRWAADFDWATGFVTDFVGFMDEISRRDDIQVAPLRTSSGIEFPSFTARIAYIPDGEKKARVDQCHVYVVKSAVFNEELPEDAFSVATPKGTNIVNFRAATTRTDGNPAPEMAQAREEVPSARAVADDIPRYVGRSDQGWGTALVCGALGMIAAVAVGTVALRAYQARRA